MEIVSTLSEWPARWEEEEQVVVVGRNLEVKKIIPLLMKMGRGRRGLLRI